MHRRGAALVLDSGMATRNSTQKPLVLSSFLGLDSNIFGRVARGKCSSLDSCPFIVEYDLGGFAALPSISKNLDGSFFLYSFLHLHRGQAP